MAGETAGDGPAGAHAAVPVVIITGHDTPESRVRAVQLGVKGYLCKPVNDEALLAAIGSAIGQMAA
jgi:DNA-binding NarL/FixJ family response regulator